jgi:kumamolisin
MKNTHVRLDGSERHFLPGSTVVGTANPHDYVELTIKIHGQNPLPDIIGRPVKMMTHQSMAGQYGASATDVKKVTRVLTEFGLDFIGSNNAARSIYMSGTVEVLENAFDVKLISYTHETGDYRGRVGYVHIPKELSGIVVGVFGLDSRKMISRKKPRNLRSSVSIANAVQRAWFFPEEIAEKYNFPKHSGAGQSIGILEFGGGYFPDDLKMFCKTAKVPIPTVVPISVDHTSTSQMDDVTVEVMMDIEIVAGVCPKATIPVYFGHFTERGWINILDKAIHDTVNKPSVLSVSYGLAEGQNVWTNAAMTVINTSFQQAALLGITICISSGDDGSDAQVGDGYAHVSFPSSSPFVLAVGGTNLTVVNGKINETVWKDGDGLRKDNGGSTGGGVSSFFVRPAWQKAIKISSIDPNALTGRVLPDVAAHAQTDGNTTGYFIVVGGQSGRNGGTSAAAPLWASLIGRINALLPAGKKAGYLTPVLYQTPGGSTQTIGTAGCKDIVSGNNDSASIGGYSALKGFDATTGWGSPNGKNLLAALKKIL